MEKIDKAIAEILEDFLLNGEGMQTAQRLKELFGYEQPTIGERLADFKRSVYAWNYRNKEKYSSEALNAFISFWSMVEYGGRMKFELTANFKLGGRLATFVKLNKQFEGKKRVQALKNVLGDFNPLR